MSQQIDIIASETGIIAEALVGEGDERKKARVTIQLTNLPKKERGQLEAMIRKELENGS